MHTVNAGNWKNRITEERVKTIRLTVKDLKKEDKKLLEASDMDA